MPKYLREHLAMEDEEAAFHYEMEPVTPRGGVVSTSGIELRSGKVALAPIEEEGEENRRHRKTSSIGSTSGRLRSRRGSREYESRGRQLWRKVQQMTDQILESRTSRWRSRSRSSSVDIGPIAE